MQVQEPVVAGVLTGPDVQRCEAGEELTGDPELDRVLAELDSPPIPGSRSSGAVVTPMDPTGCGSESGGKSELSEPCHAAPTPALPAASVVPLDLFH